MVLHFTSLSAHKINGSWLCQSFPYFNTTWCKHFLKFCIALSIRPLPDECVGLVNLGDMPSNFLTSSVSLALKLGPLSEATILGIDVRAKICIIALAVSGAVVVFNAAQSNHLVWESMQSLLNGS